MGMVSREMLGDRGRLQRQAGQGSGASRALRREVKAEAAPFKLGSAALVSTWDELVAALSSGYPVTICSNQGFTLHRDRDGFCSARGTWGHCMLIAGVRFDREGACILQSWGPDVPDGPLGPGSADVLVLGRPPDQSSASSPAGDSWALARAPEFVARPLPEHWGYHQAA